MRARGANDGMRGQPERFSGTQELTGLRASRNCGNHIGDIGSRDFDPRMWGGAWERVMPWQRRGTGVTGCVVRKIS